MKIQLAIKNQGPVPAFKNTKRVVQDKSGRIFPVTGKATKKWMTKCIHSLESQLFCITRIGDGGTLTAPLQRSSIASSLPLDDSWTWIPQLNISAELVEKGNEGATITIERIHDTGKPEEINQRNT